MKAVIARRSFALADLGCAFLSGVILYSRSAVMVREAGGFHALPGFTSLWPLLIALLPCLIRLASGQFPVHRTVFDPFLVILIIWAGLGVWAAYDTVVAWTKLGLLLGGIFIFYALAGQPKENLWLSAGLVSLVGVLISLGFLFGHDFQAQPADLWVLNGLGRAWTSARPFSIPESLSPNLTGGILASLVFFPLAIAAYAWQERRWAFLIGALFAVGVIGFGLSLTSSRGAWLALLAILGLLALWELTRFPARKLGRSQETIFALILLIVILPLAGMIATRPGLLLQLANSLPGFPSGSSRLELARDSLYLIADFPFTGGGLGTFAGLYSQYIQVIPVFLFGYSHNFYLDIALEQGVIALLAFLIILGGSFYLILLSFLGHRERDSFSLLRIAVLVGLGVMAVHGLVDDAYYAGRGVVLLFTLPAFVIAIVKTEKVPPLVTSSYSVVRNPQSKKNLFRSTKIQLKGLLVTGLTVLVLFALLSGEGKTILASLYANLGSVLQAKAELAGFPSGKWDPVRTREVIESQTVQRAHAYYNRSIQLEPDNVTARYRLGLIALEKGDFPAAILQLQRANKAAPAHHGIRKVLGYAYTWTGQFDPAVDLLVRVPESQNEMEVYSWWWHEQGREDLSRLARKMAIQLAKAQNGP